ncbi:hypothetical protein [Mesorhizobium sp. M7A.T.Ca.US.000.02.2.1]|uniref:hypothetical protein n=1 Tax=Mesorhizobium sp. M7A.T.Ca.US.000.02.2.1 TaxID=2496793 RepID=UPI001FE236C1|nr:hypothetical protein [Mesorhizobium sp. M7A.T.Ca.US.000.02.2.1]
MLAVAQAARAAMSGCRQQVSRHEDRFLHRLTKKERATLLRLLRLIWTDEGWRAPFQVDVLAIAQKILSITVEPR